MKKALIFWGGWNGHDPEKISLRFQKILESQGFAVEEKKLLVLFGAANGYSVGYIVSIKNVSRLTECQHYIVSNIHKSIDWTHTNTPNS